MAFTFYHTRGFSKRLRPHEQRRAHLRVKGPCPQIVRVMLGLW